MEFKDWWNQETEGSKEWSTLERISAREAWDFAKADDREVFNEIAAILRDEPEPMTALVKIQRVVERVEE